MDRFITMGKQFGYPTCCITEFILHIIHRSYRSRPSRKLEGSGYIPCDCCNKNYSTMELIYNINVNRDKTLPAFGIFIRN